MSIGRTWKSAWGRRAVAATGLAAAVVVSMTACGNEVTAARDFYSYAYYQDSQLSVSGQLEDVVIADGALQTSKDGPFVPGSIFREDCTRPVANGVVPNSGFFTCVATVNTGQRIYVARAAVGDPIQKHSLSVLAGPHGLMTIQAVGAGLQSHDVRISVRP